MSQTTKKKDTNSRPLGRLKYLDDEFYCRARRRRVTLEKCLADYCGANALENRKSACWRCPQGKVNRTTYSQG